MNEVVWFCAKALGGATRHSLATLNQIAACDTPCVVARLHGVI